MSDGMTKRKMIIELTYYDCMHEHGGEEWFFYEFLREDSTFMHSNALGDVVGTLEVIKLLDKEGTC